MNRILKIEVFSSFEEENKAEHRRLARMSPEERCHEFSIIQERLWGKKWTTEPMIKKATFEKLAW